MNGLEGGLRPKTESVEKGKRGVCTSGGGCAPETGLRSEWGKAQCFVTTFCLGLLEFVFIWELGFVKHRGAVHFCSSSSSSFDPSLQNNVLPCLATSAIVTSFSIHGSLKRWFTQGNTLSQRIFEGVMHVLIFMF